MISSGPRFSSSQRAPACAGAGLPGGTGTSCNSWGGRCSAAAGNSRTGRVAASPPTNKHRASSSGKLRRHSPQGLPQPRVISNKASTSDSRQMGPARIGLSKKARVQSSFRRGSSRHSQAPPPSCSATYWPIGS